MESTIEMLTENRWRITYGYTHPDNVILVLGVDLRDGIAKVIDNFSLWGTYRQVWLLPDKRVVIVHSTQHGFHSDYEILPNREAYRVWVRNEDLSTQDFEPGARVNRNSIGQNVGAVRDWIQKHPGEPVPENRANAPELWEFPAVLGRRA